MCHNDVAGATKVTVGDKEGPPTMHVTALQSPGLDVDPEAGRLKSVEMPML